MPALPSYIVICLSVLACECVFTYHEDVDEVAGGGVPHLQRQIVGRCDDCAVMAVPCYHGNLQLCHLVFQRRRVVLPVGKDVDTPMSCLDQYCLHKILNKRHIFKRTIYHLAF